MRMITRSPGHTLRRCVVRCISLSCPSLRLACAQKITSFISTSGTSNETRLPKSVKTTWSGYDVFCHLEDPQCIERRDELLREDRHKPRKRGQKLAPIAAINIARSELWGELSDDEQQKFQTIADAWSEEGPDEKDRAGCVKCPSSERQGLTLNITALLRGECHNGPSRQWSWCGSREGLLVCFFSTSRIGRVRLSREGEYSPLVEARKLSNPGHVVYRQLLLSSCSVCHSFDLGWLLDA